MLLRSHFRVHVPAMSRRLRYEFSNDRYAHQHTQHICHLHLIHRSKFGATATHTLALTQNVLLVQSVLLVGVTCSQWLFGKQDLLASYTAGLCMLTHVEKERLMDNLG